MIRLIIFLITGKWQCAHKWTILTRVDVMTHDYGPPLKCGSKYELQCEKCGDVSKRTLIP